MAMKEWAENEIKIACKKENPDWDGKSFDYGCSCYQSALKAYKSLCDDEHSGFSFSVTKNILIRLMNSLPLTAVEDKEGEWTEICSNTETTTYQHSRISSLFKDVDKDGNVSYHDNNRFYCQNASNPKDTYSGGIGKSIIDELFPITMPYYPSVQRYKFVVEEFVAKGFEGDDEGDYNTVGVLYVITPEGEQQNVHRFFGEKNGKLVRIGEGEYIERLRNKI